MKEIGEALREQRETIGVSIEEAANDLKLRPSQIEAIESGNKDAFQDIFYLKYFIKDYSKYLGLNYEDMVDEFNEFLFDYTSKISLDEIKKAKKKSDNDKLEHRVASPYTIERRKKRKTGPIIFVIIMCILALGIGYYIYNNNLEDNNPHVDNIIK